METCKPTDQLSIEFPVEFECGKCTDGTVHTADFQGAFVRDTAGNWYFDLGKVKGHRLMPEDMRDVLEELFRLRTVTKCKSCSDASSKIV
jgi:hypothetical protein